MKGLICLFFCCILIISSALAQDNFRHIYKSRLDITWGNTFYLIYANEDGEALILKGGYEKTSDGPKYTNVKISKPFILKSVATYFKKLRALPPGEYNESVRCQCPHIDIYLDGKQIFDGPSMDNLAMEVQIPLMKDDLPRGFSPYRKEGNLWY